MDPIHGTKGFQDTLSKLGDTWEVPAELNDKLEEFTTAMYGRGMYKSVNAARLDMLRAKCGGTDGIDLSRNIDLGQFPPCLNALQQHTSDVPTIRPAYVKQLINLDQGHPLQLMVMVEQLFIKKFTFVVQWSIDAFMNSFGRLQAAK